MSIDCYYNVMKKVAIQNDDTGIPLVDIKSLPSLPSELPVPKEGNIEEMLKKYTLRKKRLLKSIMIVGSKPRFHPRA